MSLSPYDCYERVQQRNRKGEEDITMDYLEECEKFFEKWLNETNIPINIYSLNSESVSSQCKENIKDAFLKYM